MSTTSPAGWRTWMALLDKSNRSSRSMPFYDPDLQCVWVMDDGDEHLFPIEVVGRGNWPIKRIG